MLRVSRNEFIKDYKAIYADASSKYNLQELSLSVKLSMKMNST
jgi:hypothetical protein